VENDHCTCLEQLYQLQIAGKRWLHWTWTSISYSWEMTTIQALNKCPI